MSSLEIRALGYRIVAGFLGFFAVLGFYMAFEGAWSSWVIALFSGHGSNGLSLGRLDLANRAIYWANLFQVIVAVVLWYQAGWLARRTDAGESGTVLDLRRVNEIVASAVGLFILASAIPTLVEIGSALVHAMQSSAIISFQQPERLVALVVRMTVGLILLIGWRGLGRGLMGLRELGRGSFNQTSD